MPTITYETPDGPTSITRDDYHTDNNGVLIAWDDTPGDIENKVTIPLRRVVIVHG